MRIIIDGYNVLKPMHAHVSIDEQKRQAFIAMLAKYARAKQHEIVLVFDGGPQERPYSEKYKSITVTYAGTKSTADEYILEYVMRHRGADMLVVSADNALCSLVAQEHVSSIDGASFMNFVHNALGKNIQKQGSPLVKTGASSSEIDILMEQVEMSPAHRKNNVTEITRETQRDTLSKTERQHLKKLQKL